MVIDQAMQEEIRVTVIATGFGRAEEKKVSHLSHFKKVAPVAPMSFSIRENNKDIPAFMRKKVTERFEEVKLEEPSHSSADEDDRYDIPTFLRKQAD
jgi:cell division protein FtsZ